MITKRELESIAKLKGLTIENCEADYLQDLLLFTIYQTADSKLAFKGGTCLYKIYKLPRFSEDLDFTMSKKLKIERAITSALYSIKLLNINATVKEMKKFQNEVNARITFHGPLYDGSKESARVISLNLSSRERTSLKPEIKRITPLYNDIPSFELFTMNENEILAEKIRTILQRNKSRDVYDAWFLLAEKKLAVNHKILQKKLKRKFNKSEFMQKIMEKKPNWEKELKRFITGTLPPFNQVYEEINKSV